MQFILQTRSSTEKMKDIHQVFSPITTLSQLLLKIKSSFFSSFGKQSGTHLSFFRPWTTHLCQHSECYGWCWPSGSLRRIGSLEISWIDCVTEDFKAILAERQRPMIQINNFRVLRGNSEGTGSNTTGPHQLYTCHIPTQC